MEQKQVKEILGRQLELLAEVSKKTSKPEELPELTKATPRVRLWSVSTPWQITWRSPRSKRRS